MRTLVLLALVLVTARGAEIPLRIDAPTPDGAEVVPVAGGVPFPRGALDSVDHLRLLGPDGKEIAAQAARLAVWPDGSVKWALIDAVLAPKDGQALRLEYGAGVTRAAVPAPLAARIVDGNAEISGARLSAHVRKDGGGFIDQLTLDGREVIAAGSPARLRIGAVRLPEDASADAIPPGSFLCRSGTAKACAGTVAIDAISLEAAGPIRATVLIRGAVLLDGFGSGLPEEVLKREPPGRLPFSMRVSFYAGTGVVFAQHQIIYSGEPDRDFITHWGIELPRLGGKRGLLCAAPGVELDQREAQLTVAPDQRRLCWAPLDGGVALIRHGWENRPTAIRAAKDAALIEFWPEAAGVLDLRRYAREWSVGETGDAKNPKDMERYAHYAARGMAKSFDAVIDLARQGSEPAALARAQALSDRALLVAQPAWYASTLALGPLASEGSGPDAAALDDLARRRIDYHLFAQDLFGWYGTLVYGFWQSRYGQAHRNDRWDCDYGRWGWSLGDGGGRVGHMLMLEFLRTLDRRYFAAGEAYSRICYDTDLVHTQQHLENAKGWWTAIGCSHRHNVQPFGCPYVGMRGSYPVGQRILWELTGDGVIADGLDLVAGSSQAYAEGAGSRLCASGDSDGQGSAAHALLWKYEATGDAKFLAGCRTILDKSGLIPTAATDKLGYGPSFGLFSAAGEYAALSGDADFTARVVAMAKAAAGAKNAAELISAIAWGAWLSRDAALTQRLGELAKQHAAEKGGLDDEPRTSWPGHGGWKTPALSPNALRDLFMAEAVLAPQAPLPAWPTAASAAAKPASEPADWYHPGGAQRPDEKIDPEKLVALRGNGPGGELRAGAATWTIGKQLIEDAALGGAHPLAGAIAAYIELARPSADPAVAAIVRMEATPWSWTRTGDTLIGSADVPGSTFTARIAPVEVEGAAALRIELACTNTGRLPITRFGLLIPCALGKNAHAIETTAPGRFRLERCRLDQNDERIPSWLTSETRFGEGAPAWPRWRLSGIEIGPGDGYRIWRANRGDTAPVVCDQGLGPGNWLDLTDRGSTPRWGLTARVLRASHDACAAIRADLESGMVDVQLRSMAAPPLDAGVAVGAVDLILHDGWRPPLSKPELTPAQYDAFIADLDHDEQYGLAALRFALSTTHKVQGKQWLERLRDLGVEPREILYGMLFGDGLATHCRRIGVPYDAADVEGTVRRVVEHYRK